MSLVRTLTTWLKLTKQSSQYQTNKADYTAIENLSESLNDSIEKEAAGMSTSEQERLKGFLRVNSGQTLYAGRPYKLLLIANPKGGVGKSSLAVLLAAFSGLEKLKFADTDPQQSTKLAFEAMFGQVATGNSQLVIDSFADLEKVVRRSAGQNKQTILVDTSAGLSPHEVAEARVASLLLVPVSSSSVELKAARKFISSLQENNYSVPILIVPNKINDNSDLLKIISVFRALPCMLASPVPYDRRIEKLLADQHFPGELANLREAAFPLIRSINNAIKSPYLPDSKLRQID